MKKSLLLAASVSAAATATATISSVSKVRISLRKDDNLEKNDENCSKPVKASTSSDKFAPRFDGLRFIETLVTAHR
ncbi:hypothetical protein KY290_031959 [Solanum tuberosum]|uniref:Uncharacterized protein n=2 Tax=Solanum tuberosum TaxID=4113 RepID=A0ABQ7UAQ4_SOLTU|nr:PREDICTED: uncharacterized protein LOC102595357 [Solanum tuberosum]KAH0651114.1 hypothetical protein KY284_031026 [Solanum tuberosum]KAH0743966.1 hypothetical protein KY290_031959 [Solanum tuberosum]